MVTVRTEETQHTGTQEFIDIKQGMIPSLLRKLYPKISSFCLRLTNLVSWWFASEEEVYAQNLETEIIQMSLNPISAIYYLVTLNKLPQFPRV